MAPWLSWLLLGLVAGTLAKFLVPGRDPPGCLVTTALGIAGAFVGGLVATALGWGQPARGGLDARSVALATFGAILVLLAGRLLLGRLRDRGRRPR
ncbi:MAG TPA: GlsB/YeaQ/YmgE family stress response membrane protein [Gemmatimonadaceae bacterium]|nr:GlsB/YeaQ/YmgE family stress response membrane protein [Gemmatimonadaceae bacterium]